MITSRWYLSFAYKIGLLSNFLAKYYFFLNSNSDIVGQFLKKVTLEAWEMSFSASNLFTMTKTYVTTLKYPVTVFFFSMGKFKTY